ncbi:phenylacetaldoxime dehydratase family protein [Cryptosporangium aurantiacum]|uniref:phenylacetaldoxime dehydratase family protein n=1 Tax=Cryptosporangium aurantiacum TaxID=134849 RepID=UPI0009344EE9
MESAIPPHLTTDRTRTRRIPDDYAPPYPSFVARPAPSVKQVVMAYFGVQGAAEPATFPGPDGPGHVEYARGEDLIATAYWDDPAAFDRWFAAHRAEWLGDAVREPGVGRWVEILRPTVEAHETLFSSLGRPEGVAVLADEFSGPVQEHAYWGGMRDRIPLSQTDPMAAAGGLALEHDGGRVRVRPQHGLCLIRSGQDWADTDGEERELYLRDVEPVLRAGMDYLRDEGSAIGCYSNRYVTVLEDGAPVDRSYGLSWWRSLDALERWAESHPTHVAIFGAAMKYLTTVGPAARVRLYHEVSVATADEQYFEYVDCRPGTGLLAAFE